MSLSQAAARLDTPQEFFERRLQELDPEIAAAIRGEVGREQRQIELIASENFASPAVLEAQGSVLTNKYAEGYPGRRYYGGCEFMDVAEQLAIDRARRLFGCAYVNVQPHSGASANLAVFLALLQPGDTILGMSLAAGGHLTHAPPNVSGKWFQAIGYGVRRQDQRIDFDEVRALAERHRPKLIIAGGSAYPRGSSISRSFEIADGVGAYLMVDMAHIAGLVATVCIRARSRTPTSSPAPRTRPCAAARRPDPGRRPGARQKLNSATFPGLQGGPLMHVIAAKAVAFEEALCARLQVYARRVVENARALAEAMVEGGLDLVSGGTDNHLLLVDLRPKRLTGRAAEDNLERAGITCNMNGIPFDPEKPTVTSGIRLGSPAATTRGFGIAEFQQTGRLIVEVLDGLAAHPDDNHAVEDPRPGRGGVCAQFPVYGHISRG